MITHITYKQIIEAIESAAINNLNIASFSFGEQFEITKEHDIEYPHFFLESAILVNTHNQVRDYSMAFQIIDRSLEDLSNRIDILSKCEQIYESFMLYLADNNPDWFGDKSQLQFTAIPFIEAYNDRVYGWRVEFEIQVPWSVNLCSLPYNAYL